MGAIKRMIDGAKPEGVKNISAKQGIVRLISRHGINTNKLSLIKEKTCEMAKNHFIYSEKSQQNSQNLIEVFLIIKYLKQVGWVIGLTSWSKFLEELDPKAIIKELKA